MLSWIRSAARELRRWPRLGAAALRLVPDLSVQLRFPHLGPFRVRLRRNRAFWLRDPEEFERVPFAMLASLVRAGDVVADLGANLGLYVRFLLSHAGASRVLAFEPWAENRKLLAENIRLGGVEGSVALLPYAVGDVDAEVYFQVDDVQSASGSLDSVRLGEPSEGRANLRLPPLSIRVPCRTLDNLIDSGEIPEPDVLKIDVEGAEVRALKGADGLLRRRRPRILVELHGAREAREVLASLLDLGYETVGLVERQLDPSGFSALSSVDIARIQGRYDVHFIAASCDGGVPTPAVLAESPFGGMG